MGFRFRKSINLGGGVRMNLSKSGVGFSAGVKGARITKKATGGTRTTLSVPGTGLSYVKESSSKKSSTKANRSSSGAEQHASEAEVLPITPERIRRGLINARIFLCLGVFLLLIGAIAVNVPLIVTGLVIIGFFWLMYSGLKKEEKQLQSQSADPVSDQAVD